MTRTSVTRLRRATLARGKTAVDEVAERYLDTFVALDPCAATELGVLGHDDEPLFLEKRRIDKEQQMSFTVVVDKRPERAGIDPYNKLIDRSPKDNTVAVNIE